MTPEVEKILEEIAKEDPAVGHLLERARRNPEDVVSLLPGGILYEPKPACTSWAHPGAKDMQLWPTTMKDNLTEVGSVINAKVHSES